MKALILLAALGLVQTYELNRQAASVPAVLAVKSGNSYSARDNVMLRSEDLAGILSSGNFVTLQGKEGSSDVTYAAIPVVRNGNTYTVAKDTLNTLRQFGTNGVAGSPTVVRDAATANTGNSFSTRAQSSYATPFATSATGQSSVSVSNLNSAADSVSVFAPATVSAARTDASYGSRVATVSGFRTGATNQAVSGSSLAQPGPATRSSTSYSSGSNGFVSSVRSDTAPAVSATITTATHNDAVSIEPAVRDGAYSTVSNTFNPATRNDAVSVNSAVAATNFGVQDSSLNVRTDDSNIVYGDEIPGVAGVDYSTYTVIPQTQFTCAAQGNRYGYYADVETKCQVFHVCQENSRSSFLCPVGTAFNQESFVCDWWFNVDCKRSAEFYSLNARFGIVPESNPAVETRTSSTAY